MNSDRTEKIGNKKLLAVVFSFLLFSSYATLATDAFGQVPTLQTINQQATGAVITGSQTANSKVSNVTQTTKNAINAAAPLAISKIAFAAQAAITSVNTASQKATSDVNASAVSADSAINAAAGQLTATTGQVATTSISKINKLNQTAIQDIATVTPQALSFVATSNQTAIKNINNASSQTIFAITTANTTVTSYLSSSAQAVASAISNATPLSIKTINTASQNANSTINATAVSADSAVNNAAGQLNATTGSVAKAGTQGIGTVNKTAIGGINSITPQAVSGIKFANSTVSTEAGIATPAAVGEINSATQAANAELSTASQAALSQISIINQAGISNQVTSNAASNVTSANNTATTVIANTGQASSSAVTRAGQNATSITSNSTTSTITSVNSASQKATSSVNASAVSADSAVNNAAGQLTATTGSVAKAGTQGIGTVNKTAIGGINSITPQAVSGIKFANQTSVTNINTDSGKAVSAIKTANGQVITAITTNTPAVDAAISSAASAETVAINSASQKATSSVNASAVSADSAVNNAAGQLTATTGSVALAGTQGIGTVNKTAITNINTVGQQAITEIKLANKTAIAEINAETPSAVSEINIIGQLALSEISQINSTSIKEINAATTAASTVTNTVSPTTTPVISTVNNTATSTTSTATGTVASTTSTATTTVNNTINGPSPIPGSLIPTIPSSITSPSTPALSSQTVPIPPSANYSVSQTKSGQLVFDSFTNETRSQQQLQANPGYWTYGGDAPLIKAPYAFWRDPQGLHVGVEAPTNGTYAGYYALSQTHGMLFHSVITTPVQVVPSTNNYYENGMYVQNGTQNVSYVDCTSISSQWGTGWSLEMTRGNNFGATTYTNLWWSGWSKSGPLTRDCTIITNGTNYLKVYINGTMVYQNNTLNLQMTQPRVTFLEPQSNYAGQLLNGTFKTFYVATGESVKVTNNPPVASTVKLVEPTTGNQGVVVATSRVDSTGTATLPIGNYTMPLKAYVIVYDSSGNVVASTSQAQGLYGGDVYSVSGTPVSYGISYGTSNATNTASAGINDIPAPLPPPTGLAATAISSSQISLTWNAPNTSLVVSGYNIDRSTNGGTTWSNISTNEPSTMYVDSGLVPSTTYTYRVSANYNGIATSYPSNTASATTQSTTYKLVVSSQLTTGGSVTGLYTTLVNSTGQLVATGFTPATFILKNGAQYSVSISNYATYTFDHWADTGSAVEPRSISISSDTQIAAIFKDTALQLSPSRGTAGSSVTATGTTFAANKTITLTWDGTALATTPASITSSPTGGFSATFQVPSTASLGTHTVSATDGINTHLAQFVVGLPPSITVTSSSVNVGTDVRVTGTNFNPNSHVSILYDNYLYAFNTVQDAPTPSTITTNSNGSFAAVITIQHSVTGTHTIAANDSANDVASQQITMKPHVFIYPASGPNGTQVLIPASQGNGFAANSPIAIKFDTNVISTSPISTDSTGNFGGTFAIPGSASQGAHQITISDNSGNSYTIPFTVTSVSAPMYSIQTAVAGLNNPDRMAFIPDNGPGVDGSGAFMVIEKNSGNVLIFKNVNGQFTEQPTPFVTVPNLQTGAEDNGLLGIAIDPNWASSSSPSKLVYLYVTRTVNGAVTGEVIRYHATTDSSGNIVADTSVPEQVIINIPNWQDGHNGGCIRFDSAGNLYIEVSDGWTFFKSQDLTSLQGKLLKITPLGSPVNGQLYSIPSTNPFASSSNANIKKEIWGWGLRNGFSFGIDSSSGKIYLSDVGYNAWETVDNFTTGGQNVGWPYYESPPYGNPNNLQNYEPSIYWYPHEGVEAQTNPEGIEAIIGGTFYHGSYYPKLDGAYLFADYGVHFIDALLPSSTSQPQVDPARAVPESQAVPIYYDNSLMPADLAVWNNQVYIVDLTGKIYVLTYGTNSPSSTGCTSPTCPTNLTAKAVSTSQINLGWNSPSGVGLVVTGYKVERETGSGTWQTINANTGNTATTYSDTGLATSTLYSYRVSAIYGLVTSQPSNTASATTQCAVCMLQLDSKLTTGEPLTGLYTTLSNSTGQMVSSGFTPVTFSISNGKQYSVGMGAYSTFVFDHWVDNNSTANPRSVSITSNTHLTAVYRDTAPLVLNPSSGPAGTTVTVTGTAFAANHSITLTYDGAPVATSPTSIVTSASGGFTATFQVPLGSVGPHEVSATDGTIHHSAYFSDTA